MNYFLLIPPPVQIVGDLIAIKAVGFIARISVFRNNLEPFDATAEVSIDAGEGIAKVIADDTGTVNLLWPLPVITWQQRSGDVEQTYSAPAVSTNTIIQAGNPYAQVGTSALWNTDRKPFDCWLGPQGQVPYSPNQALNNINAETQELVNQSAGLNRVQKPSQLL